MARVERVGLLSVCLFVRSRFSICPLFLAFVPPPFSNFFVTLCCSFSRGRFLPRPLIERLGKMARVPRCTTANFIRQSIRNFRSSFYNEKVMTFFCLKSYYLLNVIKDRKKKQTDHFVLRYRYIT